MQSSTKEIAPGVDVKAEGGYVIMPPSVLLPSKLGPGRTYRFEKGGLDQLAALPPFPDPLRARLNAKKKKKEQRASSTKSDQHPAGNRGRKIAQPAALLPTRHLDNHSRRLHHERHQNGLLAAGDLN